MSEATCSLSRFGSIRGSVGHHRMRNARIPRPIVHIHAYSIHEYMRPARPTGVSYLEYAFLISITQVRNSRRATLRARRGVANEGGGTCASGAASYAQGSGQRGEACVQRYRLDKVGLARCAGLEVRTKRFGAFRLELTVRETDEVETRQAHDLKRQHPAGLATACPRDYPM